MSPAGNAQFESAGTPDEILTLAERLFAELGVENVPLTRIAAAAGQRNRSAVHYHFGSRAGVLTAVMNRRLAAINARREALADALPSRPSVAQVARADVSALGHAVVQEPWGADYLSILAQVTFHPTLLAGEPVAAEHLSGIRRCRRLLAEALPALPPGLLARRMAWLTDAVVFAMARWVRERPSAERTAAAMDALIEDLVAFGTAGLAAPDPAPFPKEPTP